MLERQRFDAGRSGARRILSLLKGGQDRPQFFHVARAITGTPWNRWRFLAALEKLLEAVTRRQIDVIVVYKVDRLIPKVTMCDRCGPILAFRLI
jgi:hypothetical protein